MRQLSTLLAVNLLVLLVLLLVAESLLRLGVWLVRDDTRAEAYGSLISAQESLVTDVPTFRAETAAMMAEIMPHPLRWYQLPQVNGTYMTTDARGFRFTPQAAAPDAPVQIGFFL